jgi:iron complex transport system permease protein
VLSPPRAKNPWLACAALLALVAGAAALRLLAAPDGLSLPLDAIEWRLRGERVASGLAVGMSLAVAGVFLQALLRNPLAEPAVLGLTTGAGLGVALWVYAAYRATGVIVQYHAPIAPALLGSLGALAVVGALGQRRGLIEPVTLILVGVVVSLVCGAGILFVQHLLPDRGVALAQLDATRATDLSGTALLADEPFSAMDAASMSEDEARSVGVRLGALRATLFLLAGALTAGSVLLAGPIGFIGLVCPHLARMLGGAAHRPLVVNAALLGGSAIVLADAGVRLIDLGAGRMPIGVLTAIIGGPVFIALLRREMRR